jgi:hypothetical protein
LLGCDGIFSRIRELLLTCIPGNYATSPLLRHLGVAWVRGVCKEEGQLKHWIDSGSFIATMTHTTGSVFVAECDQSNGDLFWFVAFSMELTPDNQLIDDRDEILHQITRRLGESSWHSCVNQIVQDTANSTKNGPLLFRNLYDRMPEDVFFLSLALVHSVKYC